MFFIHEYINNNRLYDKNASFLTLSPRFTQIIRILQVQYLYSIGNYSTLTQNNQTHRIHGNGIFTYIY